jgi:PAS domain S-box-containing protein
MGALMRSHAWASTALGPPAAWPQSLRTSVSTCLNCSFPILLWWGPELTMLYNDAYATILGNKHPAALGTAGREVWPEIWATIGPMLERVVGQGEAARGSDLLLIMSRYGYDEETYFNFSYSPIRDETGGIGGVFTPVIETTDRVISERRLQLLGRLGTAIADARSIAEVCAAAAIPLSGELAARDLPFLALYEAAPSTADARLVACSGCPPGSPLAPPAIALDPAADAPWPLAEAAASGEAVPVSAPRLRFPSLPRGPWDIEPQHAVVIPIGGRPGSPSPAFMVACLNPLRPAEEVRGFATLLANQLATAISNALAYEAERRRAEALAQVDRAKTAFFSNVSHEFRTPLTLMLGPLEQALRRWGDALRPDLREELELVHRNALRLQKLVNALLDFSRVEAGRTQARYVPTDLSELTADLASGFRSACERAGLALVVDCQPLPEPAYVDRGLWENIVLNLLSNALKFTFEGRIALSVRPEDDAAVLVVEDSGVGIPSGEIPHLFERFHRIPGQRSRTHEGSGIGLALVQELVALHGGTINVHSEEGRGTSFTIRMPLGTGHLPAGHVFEAAPQAEPQAHSLAGLYADEALGWLPHQDSTLPPPPSADIVGPRPRILVADDNADMRGYVARLLEQFRDVDAVSDGEAALAALRARRPDLIVSDMMMPRLDGASLVRAIRADPTLQDLPVILLSARAGAEARVEGLDTGADDYIAKPFAADELIARIRTNLAIALLRRQAIDAAREGERRMLRLFEQAPGFMIVLRGPNHVFELANAAYYALIGPRDLIGRPVREALPEVVSQGFVDILNEVFATGVPFVGRGVRLFLHRGQDLPREERFVDFIYQPITDEAGAITGIFCEGSDVTKRVQAARQLQSLNTTLEARVAERTAERDRLWEISEDLLVIATFDGRLLRVSPAWTQALGWDEPTLLSRSYLEIIHPDDRSTVLEALDEMRRTGRPVRYRDRVLAKDGSYRTIAWALSPDPDGTRLHGVGRDITVELAQEAALDQIQEELRQAQKLESIGQLTGGIAHDFNNLLAAIRGGLELAGRRIAQGRVDQVEGYLKGALTATDRGAALTHRLLAFARRQALDPKPVSPDTLLGGMAELVRHTVGPSIRVEVRLAASGALVLCDANQLENAALNLVINARDAMPNSGVLQIFSEEVHLSATEAAGYEGGKPGNYVQLCFADSGVGMPADVLSRAFEPFFTTKPSGQGTGLGLSQIYGFVRQSNGLVRLESTPGKGTTVHILLPRYEGPIDEVDAHRAQAEAPLSAAGIVLLVEDEPEVRSITAEVLEELGCTVLQAADGPSAMEILRSRRGIDVLVTDVGLPGGLNGRQLADAARELRPRLPVLFITGYAGAALAEWNLLPGMEVIGKPYALTDFSTRVAAMLNAARG